MRKFLLFGAVLFTGSAPAAAATPTLSLKRAQAAITRSVGPGTTESACRRVSARSIRCRYETPGVNVGLSDDSEAAIKWYSYALAYLHAGRVRVT